MDYKSGTEEYQQPLFLWLKYSQKEIIKWSKQAKKRDKILARVRNKEYLILHDVILSHRILHWVHYGGQGRRRLSRTNPISNQSGRREFMPFGCSSHWSESPPPGHCGWVGGRRSRRRRSGKPRGPRAAGGNKSLKKRRNIGMKMKKK